MDDGNGSLLADGIACDKLPNEQYKKGKEWKDKRFKNGKYSFWKGIVCVRSFPRGTELPKDISTTDTAYMYRCSMMLQHNTNMLVKRYANYEREMSVKMLAEELGIKERQCQRFIKRMEEKRILKRENRKIYINPIYFICGKYLTWHLYMLFQDDLDAFLPDWVVDRFNGDINA